jgi:hypothetical protein
VAITAASFERGSQPRIRIAFAFDDFRTLPRSGTIERSDGSKHDASRGVQLGITRVGMSLAAPLNRARNTFATSWILITSPATAKKRCPAATGSTIARMCKSATSRTSTTTNEIYGVPGIEPSIKRLIDWLRHRLRKRCRTRRRGRRSSSHPSSSCRRRSSRSG